MLRLTKVFNTFECRQVADVDRITNGKTGNVHFDELRKLGRTATNFNFVRLVVDHATFVLHTQCVGLTIEVNWNVSNEALTAMHFEEIDVLDLILDRMVLNILDGSQCTGTLVISQLDERSATSDFTIELAKIDSRDRN